MTLVYRVCSESILLDIVFPSVTSPFILGPRLCYFEIGQTDLKKKKEGPDAEYSKISSCGT